MYDIIIIGAGIAGLSAAIYGKRAGKSVLVLEKNMYGGQIVVSPEVDNYPGISHISGYELAMKLYEQARELDVEIRLEKVTGFSVEKTKIIKTESAQYEAKNVIIATGLEKRKLGLENEDRFVGSGISYCATCDGAFFKGKNVAVVGGGNTALEDAIFLAGYCKKVSLIHRRSNFRGEKKLEERLVNMENVEFIMNTEVIQLEGKSKIEHIVLKSNINNSVQVLDVDGLFVAVGQEPQSELYKNLVKTDDYGYVMAGEDCRTNIDGVFVAGDCRTKEIRQLVTAAADGAVAAVNACR